MNCFMCHQHLCDNGEDFNSDAYNLLATIGKENNIFLNAKEIENLLDDLRDACLKEKENQNYNYLERIPKDRFKDEFGISSTDLDNLYNHVKENGTASKMALAAYLMYLRTGQSQAQIASKFRMSQSNFSRYIDTARCDLINIFVPLHLGITNRQVLRDNCTVIAKTLYNLGEENIVTKCRFARLAINEILDFPRFTVDELKKISGAYQLSLAKSYIGDHLYNGEYEFEVMKEDKHPNYQSV
ncbi:vacuolar protein sorting-associated protein 13c, partial [Lasius niger]